MDHIYNIAKFLHVISFAFMSIPLFNLIIVNERALMGPSLNYATDRYFENIIKRGAIRCYVFQCTVFLSGMVILFLGPGLSAVWTNWVLTAKTLILLLLMSLLFYPLYLPFDIILRGFNENKKILKISVTIIFAFFISFIVLIKFYSLIN